jgi:hypothetical protein
VFCSDATQGSAEFRIRGYYFVIRNDTSNGVDVQLRPVELTPEEAAKYTTDPRYGRNRT